MARPTLTFEPTDRPYIVTPEYIRQLRKEDEREERHQQALQEERDARQLKWCRAQGKAQGRHSHEHFDDN